MSRPDAERVWLAFAQSALAGVTSINIERDPHNGPTWEEINAKLADECATLADAMLERWQERYPPSVAVGRPPATPPRALPSPKSEDGIDW